jgi:N6-adenosine-specific RNA methylase IME4
MSSNSFLVKQANFLDIPGCVFSKVGVEIVTTLSFHNWERLVNVMQDVEGAVQFWVGDVLCYGEKRYGEKYAQALAFEESTGIDVETARKYMWVSSRVALGLRRPNLKWYHHKEVAALEPDQQERWLSIAESEKLSVRELRQRIQLDRCRTIAPIETINTLYQTIVIDPPWEMEKIERDVRPNQHGFDYPTMSEDELLAFPLPDLAADNCHLYLWTTHKHLPLAMRLAGVWGFNYECLLTWRKNVGFTPFSWMRSTEHVLFCRKGSLPLLRVGMRLDFEAKVREHSRKPDEFYDLVKEASPGPRIDVFSREKREGFDQWGNEIDKFEEVA